MKVKPLFKTCAAFWLLTLGLPSAFVGSIFLSWSTQVAQLGERISQHRAQIQSIQSAVSDVPTLQAALQAERSRDDLKQYYFQGETSSLSAALAQEKFNELMSDANLTVASVQTLPQQGAQGSERIRLIAQIQGTTEQLKNLLYSIETATPFLFVEELSVRSLPQRVRRPGSPAPSNDGGLVIRLRVSGFAARG